ncbi:MAG: aconitate hydratase, partial [Pollutimonas bauzanensis]
IKANFLASPPLVVAYALAGTVLRDLMTEPVGRGRNGDVWLGDIWPSNAEIQALLGQALDPEVFRTNYAEIKSNPGKLWNNISGVHGDVYSWPASTYIAEPPFFAGFEMRPAAM